MASDIGSSGSGFGAGFGLDAGLSRKPIVVHDTIGMADPWRYRNKAQVPIGRGEDPQVFTTLASATPLPSACQRAAWVRMVKVLSSVAVSNAVMRLTSQLANDRPPPVGGSIWVISYLI